MTEFITIEDLTFNLYRSARRKTVGIIVERDGELILALPKEFPLEKAERITQEKLFWIYKKLAEKEMLFRPTPPKEYVNGEGFYYLGRSHRLLLVGPTISEEKLPPLRLRQGRFMLKCEEHERAKEHFINWYTQHGQPWINQKVEHLSDRIGVIPKSVDVRDLGFRWGSCSKYSNLYFHWRTILLPPIIIEYIIAHELVHLHEPHHNDKFWGRLERAIPDFASRRQWLAENGSKFGL